MIKFNFVKTEDQNRLVVETSRFDLFNKLRAGRLTAGRFNSVSFKDARVAVILFVIIFVAVFSFMNKDEIFNGFNFNVFDGEKKETAENERLTVELRALYGYAATGGEGGWQASHAQSAGNSNAPASGNYGAAEENILPDPSAIGKLFIPKIGISAPIVKSASTDANAILNDLKKGVVLYPASSLPGTGSSVIIGHSSSNLPWRKYGRVFAELGRLVSGDSIYIDYGGKNLVYSITAKKTGTAEVLLNSGLSGDLILGSCWPVGSDKERIMVAATLQNN